MLSSRLFSQSILIDKEVNLTEWVRSSCSFLVVFLIFVVFKFTISIFLFIIWIDHEPVFQQFFHSSKSLHLQGHLDLKTIKILVKLNRFYRCPFFFDRYYHGRLYFNGQGNSHKLDHHNFVHITNFTKCPGFRINYSPLHMDLLIKHQFPHYIHSNLFMVAKLSLLWCVERLCIQNLISNYFTYL